MRVRFTAEALSQVDLILAWLMERSPAAADGLVGRLDQITHRLSDFPHAGPLRIKPDIRAIPVRGFSYIAYYRIHSDVVEILSIRHAARRPPTGADLT